MKTVSYNQVKQLAAELAGRTRDNLPNKEATMLRAFFAGELPDLWNKEAWAELCDNLVQMTLFNKMLYVPIVVEGASVEVFNGNYYYSDDGHAGAAYYKDGVTESTDDGAAIFVTDRGWDMVSFVDGEHIYTSEDLIGQWEATEGAEASPITRYLYGDLLAIIERADPRENTQAKPLPAHKISELDGRYNVATGCATVWADWQLPAPDLLEIAAEELDDYKLPARFKLILAAKGAEHLLRADGDLQGAGTMRGVAESELMKECAKAQRNQPWWRKQDSKCD